MKSGSLFAEDKAVYIADSKLKKKATRAIKDSQFWEDLKTGRFANMVSETSKGKYLQDSAEAYNILKPMFAEKDDVETFYCIFFNGQNRILAIEKMFSGSLTYAAVYPREIIKLVIALKASAILIAHNHPSGDTNPSAQDKDVTKKIVFSLTAIDVLLHDHIIVGNGYHSMADTGLLKSATDKYQKFFKSTRSK